MSRQRDQRLNLAPHLGKRIAVLARVYEIQQQERGRALFRVLWVAVRTLDCQPLTDHAWMLVSGTTPHVGKLYKLRPVVVQYSAAQLKLSKKQTGVHVRYGLDRPEVDGMLQDWAANLLELEYRSKGGKS